MTDDSIEWASNYLTSHGYILKTSSPENVQMRPWSHVVRFETSSGSIYLKQTPPLIALEADIIQVLHDQFHVSVPKIIAHNSELDCFLMHDAGKPLREILKKQFDVNLVCQAIDQFTSMQVIAADHVDLFIQRGVPDWRLDKLTFLFDECMAKENILIAEGLSKKEISELKKLSPTISDLCKTLAEFPIKQTIVQPDFNDNNTLINASQKITLIDLGEIAISHPFFSLINFLYIMKKHHSLKETDTNYQKIQEACFKNFNPVKELSDAFEIATQLSLVYGVIAYYRFMTACGIQTILSFQPGKLHTILKELGKLLRGYS